ncbi:MAG: nitrogen regulation protein NR(I) [Alphaproteobacteria bacterium]|nr:nitrogen regulation protein NR(I) [Alphaproteobacteria bacterium]MDP7428855.1 nitrogen regulation protein NR(I) [Alphaproteobacteria bacterium]
MDSATILVADDDQAIRTVLEQTLGRAGYEVRCTGNAATLWNWISDGIGDLVITDVVMPDENGLDLLPRIKRLRAKLPVVVMSARNTMFTAITAAERGAYEYLPKPFDINELVVIVKRAFESPQGSPSSPAEDPGDEQTMPLIGRSPAMQEIYRLLGRLMSTDLTVLISGDSGTGKELVARSLHDYGRRRHSPFVAVNMAAIPRELIESELFGHEKGAFTGATGRGIGRFLQAEGGTLFLDEIGDMPVEAQTRLLRVLQQGEYTAVGGRQNIKSDVRIIAATNRNLRQQVRHGLFREDLFYRLNVVPIRLPRLAERPEDIPDLVRHFLTKAAAEGLGEKVLDGLAMEKLQAYAWPGNVRELENLVRRLTALYSEELIGPQVITAELAEARHHGADPDGAAGDSLGAAVESHLSRYFSAHADALPPTGLYQRVLREVERPLIALSLTATRGNQLQAAKLLGLNRNTLRKKIREFDIPLSRGVE